MRKLSDYISMPVINRITAKKEGVVTNGLIDTCGRALRAFAIYDENEELDVQMLLPVRYAENTDGECLITAHEIPLLAIDTDCPYVTAPIGKPAYNTDGEYLGRVRDITFEDGYRTAEIRIDDRLFPCDTIYRCSEQMVLLRGTQKLPRAIRPRRKTSHPYPTNDEMSRVTDTTERPDYPTRASTDTTANAPHDTAVTPTDYAHHEPRLGYDYLLGKRLRYTVLGYDLRPIATAGNIVTRRIIDDAIRAGKIIDLSVSTEYMLL